MTSKKTQIFASTQINVYLRVRRGEDSHRSPMSNWLLLLLHFHIYAVVVIAEDKFIERNRNRGKRKKERRRKIDGTRKKRQWQQQHLDDGN
jgi:hypothetical protein